MADPLLSSLCRICHINPTKYKCPRCSQQTCSLPCSKRHKVWSSCSGVRDPTVYRPKSQLATPSGLDHDYNFLHSIEHGIERSEKEIVEERGLVKKAELAIARGERDRTRRKFQKPKGEARDDLVNQASRMTNTRLLRAPKGMNRNRENSTSWSRSQHCMNWQVEWIREADNGGRILSRSIDKWSTAAMYSEVLEEERKNNMTPVEKSAERKRKAGEHKVRQIKRARLEEQGDIFSLSSMSISQDPESGAWSTMSDNSESPLDTESASQPPSPKKLDSKYRFYLHRPKTRSSYPKVLVPIDPSQPLSKILHNRIVLEFPTIYVFETGSDELPSTFMLEKAYVKATGDDPRKNVATDSDTEDSDDDSTSSSDSTSSEDSDEDSDEEMEEGEITT